MSYTTKGGGESDRWFGDPGFTNIVSIIATGCLWSDTDDGNKVSSGGDAGFVFFIFLLVVLAMMAGGSPS